jgi:hypothetical protein
MLSDRLRGEVYARVSAFHLISQRADAMLTAHSSGYGLSLAGESDLRKVVTKGGFTHLRGPAETPFNMVLEART